MIEGNALSIRLTAGFRASPYGIDPGPSESYWYDVGSQLSSKVENSDIGCIWTVGVAGDDGKCYLNFPTDGLQYPNISDEEAESWYALIKSYNEAYTLQLKHWLTDKMPPTYRDGLFFIDDGQKFISLDHMLEYFIDWGEHFPDNPVGFQIGYPADKTWWEQYDDPYGVIANAIIADIPNTRSICWVDFCITDLFPLETYGSTYYVAPDSNNSNSCPLGSPLGIAGMCFLSVQPR